MEVCSVCGRHPVKCVEAAEKSENRCLRRRALLYSPVLTDIRSVGRHALCAPKIFKILSLISLCDQRYAVGRSKKEKGCLRIHSFRAYCSLYSTCCNINPLNPELNPIWYLLLLLGAHRFLHVSRIRVKSLTFRRLMSYIYGAPILDVSRSHTTTHHNR